LLAPDKRPDLIDLHALRGHVADHAVVVFRAGRANGYQQPKDSALRYAGRRTVERTEQPSTRAERTATFFSKLITLAMIQVYDSAFA
jgi:hypothetical protein